MPTAPNGYSANTSQGKKINDLMQLFNAYLPGYTSNQQGNIGAEAGVEAGAAAGTQPLYNLSNLMNLLQFGSPLAEAGSQIQLQNLTGTGGDVARAATDLARSTSPSYYNTLDALGNKAQDLLSSIDLHGLSPGEAASVERANNQTLSGTGNLGLNNNTNTIANAINFGGAFNNKLGLLENALNTGTSTANTIGAGSLNPTSANTLASGGAGLGLGTFNSIDPTSSSGATSNALGIGSNLLGSMTGVSNALTSGGSQISAARTSANSVPSYIGAVCCFIFMEAYHGQMPSFIRKSRDKYYTRHPDIAAGYRRLAYYLVPAMRRSVIVRLLVWHLMVSPITEYLGWSNRQAGYKKRSSFVTHFWLRVWSFLGKNKDEAQYNVQWKGFFHAS